MYPLCLFLCLMLLPVLARAEAFVCEVAATPGTFSRFVPSIDPSRFVPGATETCNQVPEAQTPSQIDLYNTVPYHYLKTTGIPPALLMAEMTASEKQAVDDAIAAKQAEQQAYVDEANGSTCKYATLDDVNTKSAAFRANMDAVINSVTNVATTQAALRELMDRLVLTMGVNLARCDLAHTKAR